MPCVSNITNPPHIVPNGDQKHAHAYIEPEIRIKTRHRKA